MSRNTTIGKHGHLILETLYRFGALTQPQLCRISGLHISNVKRQLRHLTRSGYVVYALDAARWRLSDGPARRGYYLTAPNGAKAGADALGIENDLLSLKHYRQTHLPRTVAHRLLGNEFLIAVAEAAKTVGVEIEEVSSESYPGFPLFGSGAPKSDRADSPYRYARIVPDGTFTLDGRTYLLEVETGTHARAELVKKLNDYGGRWRRLLRPKAGERKFHNPNARPEPVVTLTPDPEHKKMRDYLRAHLPDADDWQAGDAAIRDASGDTAEAGQLVIVAGIDEVRAAPLSRAYRPLFRYPEELSNPAPSGQTGWRVSLADAGQLAARITVPAKKEVA